MIKLREDILPEQDVLDKLKVWQDEINVLETFKEKSNKAKSSFPSKNKKGNLTSMPLKQNY